VIIDRQPTNPPSHSARSFFPVAPPVDGLNVVGMIVSPCPAHAAGANVVRYDVAIVGEPFLAEGTDAILRRNLSVHQLTHLGVRTDLPISSWVMGIVDATDSQLPCSSAL